MIFKLKLVSTKLSSKLLMLLHKQTNKSMVDIMKKCEQGEPVFECDSADTQRLVVLNNLNRKIVKLGFETLLFIDDKQVDTEMLTNIEKRNIEIDKEDYI